MDENPDLFDYIQGNAPQPVARADTVGPTNTKEVQTLRAEIAELKQKIRSLEEENAILQNKLLSKSTTTSSLPPGSPNVYGSADEWKKRAEQLEKENFELRKSLLVKRKSESGHSTSRTNLFATVDEDEVENTNTKPAAVTPKTADPRDLIRRRLSLNPDAITAQEPTANEPGEHPDWVKKYSDQHKRPYWRNKVGIPVTQVF